MERPGLLLAEDTVFESSDAFEHHEREMSPRPTTPALEALQALIERWRVAFDQRDQAALEEVLAPEVLFQGMGPQLLVGRQAVLEYYARIRATVRAQARVLEALPIGEDALCGFVMVAFVEPGGNRRLVRVSITAQKRPGAGWQIVGCHASAPA